MTEIIRTYICNKKFTVFESSENKGISYEEDYIKARIVPVGCDTGLMRVFVDIISEDAMYSSLSLFRCVDDPKLEWSRRVITNSNGDFTERENLITITVSHFSYPCKRLYTAVHNIRKMSANLLFLSYPLTIDEGLVPEEGGKRETHKGSTDVEIRNTQTQFVPGDLLQLKWGASINDRPYQSFVAGNYFSTPAITGGVVVESAGTKISKQYLVKTQGHTLYCVPTDFAEYAIGDWIYLIKQRNNDAGKVSRTTSYTNSNAEISETNVSLRPVPMTVNGIGNEGRNFETMDYDMLFGLSFEKFFEMSKHIGEILSVDQEADMADVRIEEDGEIDGNYSNVPIKYLCEDSKKFENGARGFKEGDKVIILNEFGESDTRSGNMIVVGHEDSPRLCGGMILVISSKSGSEAFAWDANEGELLLEKDKLTNIQNDLYNMGYECEIMGISEEKTRTTIHDPHDGEDTTVEGIWNVPDCYIEGSFSFGFTDLNFRPADLIATERDEEGRIEEVEHTHSRIEHPEIGETKARYYVRFGYLKDSETNTHVEFFFNHHLFDAEEPDSWKRPEIVENEETGDQELKQEVYLFAQQYYQKEYEADETWRYGQDSGISQNSSGIVCFENVGICWEWNSDNYECEKDYERYLRIFAKYNMPDHTVVEQKVAELIDFERENRGLPKNVWNPLVYAAAKGHSEDMAENEFVGHEGSNGSSLDERVIDAGYLEHETIGFRLNIDLSNNSFYNLRACHAENVGKAGNIYYESVNEAMSACPEENYENIFREVLSQDEYADLGSAEIMVALWMSSSEGHRDLILNEGDTLAGDNKEDLSESQLSELEKADYGIAMILDREEQNYYGTFDLSCRPNMWKGFFPVSTEEINEYIKNNFEFSGDGDGDRMINVFLA